jgi:hypothetical protein
MSSTTLRRCQTWLAIKVDGLRRTGGGTDVEEADLARRRSRLLGEHAADGIATPRAACSRAQCELQLHIKSALGRDHLE